MTTSTEQFVVTTVYDRPDGRRIVHTWGPFPNRHAATNEIQKMKRKDKREYPDGAPGKLTYHTGMVMGDR